MKKLLVVMLALMMLFVTGCKKEAAKVEPKAESNQVASEPEKEPATESDAPAGEKPENAPAEEKKEDVLTEEKKEEAEPEAAPAKEEDVKSEPSIAPEDIKEPEQITETDNLEALIDEFNDPNTTEERREELRTLLGDFFNMFEGATVTAE